MHHLLLIQSTTWLVINRCKPINGFGAVLINRMTGYAHLLSPMDTFDLAKSLVFPICGSEWAIIQAYFAHCMQEINIEEMQISV